MGPVSIWCATGQLHKNQYSQEGINVHKQINESIPSRGSDTFSPEEEKLQSNTSPPDSCPLTTAWDWKMQIDLNQRLTFPPEVAVTNLRSDLVLWSKSCPWVFVVELTVPRGESVNEAFEKKKLRYTKSGNCSRESGLGYKDAARGGRLQRLCDQFHHEDSEGDGN